MSRIYRDDCERVLANTVLSEDTSFNDTPCWIWIGKRSNGRAREYGALNIRVDGKHKTVAAHRYAYEAFIGKIPEGMTIDHKCYQTLCCNPGHLEAVDQNENSLRRRSNGK